MSNDGPQVLFRTGRRAARDHLQPERLSPAPDLLGMLPMAGDLVMVLASIGTGLAMLHGLGRFPTLSCARNFVGHSELLTG